VAPSACPTVSAKDVKIAVFAQEREGRPKPKRPAPTWSAATTWPKRIEEGFDDFDVVIATPDMIVRGRTSRDACSGPPARMPNPKVGTVTMDVAKAVEESKSGKVEYRTDRTAIVHLIIGKASFDDRQLLENYAAVIERADPRQARRREGPLPALHHPDFNHGPRRQGRPQPHTVTSSRRRPRRASPHKHAAHRPTRDPRRAPIVQNGARKTGTGAQ